MTSSPSIAASIASQMTSVVSHPVPLNPPAINHFVNVKLNRENYLLWKAQLVSYLRSQQLLGYVDGTVAAPDASIHENGGRRSSSGSKSSIHDVVSAGSTCASVIISSLIEEILSCVLFMTTATEVWRALEEMFPSCTRASIMQIRMQLANLKKDDLSTTDYFQKVKSLVDTMASIERPLSDEEAITYMMVGLEPDYDALVTSMTTNLDPVTLNDMYAHLISFDLCREHNNSVQQYTPLGNSATRYCWEFEALKRSKELG